MARELVFVSHSRKNEAVVNDVKTALRRAGYQPYIASEDKHPAKQLSAKIKKAITESVAVVAVLTSESMVSPYVQQEIGWSVDRKPIVPLAAEGIRATAFLAGLELISLSDANLLEIRALVETAIDEFEPDGEKQGDDEGEAGDEEEDADDDVVDLGPLIEEGPHVVESGACLWIPLNVYPGLTIRGRLSERSSQEFEWWICDETNLVRYQNKDWRAFRAARGDQNGVSTSFKWTVPVNRRGPWFLLLSATGKKYDREIEADIYPDD